MYLKLMLLYKANGSDRLSTEISIFFCFNSVISNITYRNHEWIKTKKEVKIGEFEDGNLYFKISNRNSKYPSIIRQPGFDKMQRGQLEFTNIPKSGQNFVDENDSKLQWELWKSPTILEPGCEKSFSWYFEKTCHLCWIIFQGRKANLFHKPTSYCCILWQFCSLQIHFWKIKGL